MPTVGETLEELKSAHIRYLEATYHLSNPRLVGERHELLREEETILAEPWLEGIPRYVLGEPFDELDLDPPIITEVLSEFAERELGAYDPPYVHQQEALEAFLSDDQDIIVSTGTGSGKTEIFLYSVLAHLIREGNREKTIDQRGCRAIILYPMNALVSDQLSRLRTFLGDPDAADIVSGHFGRTVQFGKYTGQTPYHGVFDPDKNNQRVSPVIRKTLDLKGTPLYDQLKEQGKIPAKDLKGFEKGQTYSRFRTQPGDRELFTRQEMLTPRQNNPKNPENINPHGGTPDVLVTNYSMLEYTLIRPLEQRMWRDTQAWLEADEENELLIVLDEAHLYRGAQGAEISLLLARLLRHLDIDRSRVRFILTSASIGGPDSGPKPAKEFASDLTLCAEDRFEVIFGAREGTGEPGELPDQVRKAVDGVSNPPDRSDVERVAAILDWSDPPESEDQLSSYLGTRLSDEDWFDNFQAALAEGATSVTDLATTLFPTSSEEQGGKGVLNLASLISTADAPHRPGALLPLRLHLLFRGLPKLYACLNPDCEGKRDTTEGPLGAIWTSPHADCPQCGSRVFELWSHRDCGAAFIHAHRLKFPDPGRPQFLWARPEAPEEKDQDLFEEIALLVEPPRTEGDPRPPQYLSVASGMLAKDREQLGPGPVIEVWPATRTSEGNEYVHCPACDRSASPGGRATGERKPFGKIMDLETKGEAPFANLVRKLFELQPPPLEKEEALNLGLPNQGRKVLCFSDSRQKAARLARDLQRNVERDSFREILTLAIKQANNRWGEEATLDHYYIELLEVCRNHGLILFEAASREAFITILEEYGEFRAALSVGKIVNEHLDAFKDQTPSSVHTAVLRSLCDRHYSIQGTMLGMTVPTPDVIPSIENYLESKDIEISRSSLRTLIGDLILRAQDRAAVDPNIPHGARQDIGLGFRWMTEKETGLTETELFPLDLVQKSEPDLSKNDLADLTQATKMAGLVRPGPEGNYFLSPSKIRVDLPDEDTTWYRCKVCARPTPTAVGGTCPMKRCGGPVEEVGPEDPVLSARKDLFRHPATDVKRSKREPYTLRSEEHTAQLNAWNPGEMLGRAERYELLFQDILVESDEDPSPRAIDVLSCTTTMEVGIDIGSLTGVALRTVPPRPDNYQQRAGRAGRRGRALATIATYADLDPYEQFVYDNPDEIIEPSSSVPVLHTTNEKIVERHIYALMIQSFFHRVLPDGRSWEDLLEQDANLFESLGTLETFFAPEEGHDYDFEAFQKWAQEELQDPSGELRTELAHLLPSGGPWSNGPDSEEAFVKETAADLADKLDSLGSGDFTQEEADEVRLIEALIRANLRPAFGFPLDVCTFSVAGKLRRHDDPLTRHYEPQQDLQVALTEYAPGRSLVIDKRDFVSYGLHVPFPEDRTEPAQTFDWGNLDILVQCEDCESVIEVAADPDDPPVTCPACESMSVRTYQQITPEGFAPEVDKGNYIQEGERDDEGEDLPRAVRAKLPSPDLQDRAAATEHRPFGDVSELFHARNQRLVVSNLGPENEGYGVCKECGAILDGPTDGGHNRPFPKPPWLFNEFSPTCQCRDFARDVAFTTQFRTDLALLRIDASNGIDFNPYAPWFKAAATSLSEALSTAASRLLKLERGELKAGWRPFVREDPDGIERYVDLFLYDGTPGGAGFASTSYHEFQEILEAAEKLLSECDCDKSCNRCILTYDNKFQSELVDRHAALSLLGYVKTGSVPHLSDQREDFHRELLESVAQMRESDAQVVSLDTGRWEFRVNGDSLPVRFMPALRGEEMEVDGEPLTDYQLRRDPPNVVETLMLSLGR
jgi:ATP-dependent helicase YprA (DUF1998 family)